LSIMICMYISYVYIQYCFGQLVNKATIVICILIDQNKYVRVRTLELNKW